MRSTGYIVDGKYIKAQPNLADMTTDRTIVDKQYSHDQQRANHRAEMVQPYKNGKLSEEFKMLYPEESKMYEL